MRTPENGRNCHSCETCGCRDSGIFASLNGEELERLNRSKVSHHYRRGQALFYEGNPAVGLFCIRSGLVKVYKTAHRDRRHILFVARPGDVLGLESILAGGPNSTTAEMIEEGVVCLIGREELMPLMDHRPEVVRAVSRALAQRVMRSEEERMELAAADVRERLAMTLLSLGRRFGSNGDGRVRLQVQLSREELAEMIGASTETTIRQLSEFRATGTVSTRGREIILEDMARLARIARVTY